jgi:hypothetical protein
VRCLSRVFARTATKIIVVTLLPAGLTEAIAKLNTNGVRLYNSMQFKEYGASRNTARRGQASKPWHLATAVRTFYRLGFVPRRVR